MADTVVHRVAENRRPSEQKKQTSAHRALRSLPTHRQQKSSESPGRNGVTTSPVSVKMIREQQSIDPDAVPTDEFGQVNIEVKQEIDQ